MTERCERLKSDWGGPVNGTPRKDGFDITVATEMMAILLPGE